MPLDRTKIKKSKGWFIPALRYAWLTIKHRHYVFLAGLRIGVPLWRLLTHDLSKFGPLELIHYGRQFFGDASQPDKFAACWIHHQNHNDHHWEYWMPRTKHDQSPDESKALPMPYGAMLEMVADWYGASRAYEGKWPESGNWPWFEQNFDNIIVHPTTRAQILEVLHVRSRLS